MIAVGRETASNLEMARAPENGGGLRAARRANLKRLLAPRRIAVIGGREAEAVLRQCDRVGFQGEIWPVNPKRDSLGGRPCFASLADLPGVPDAAFIAVPAPVTVDLVRELAALGTAGCVCYAAGFAELGAGGAELQARLTEAAGEMALIGPNCYGLLNYLDGAALWPDAQGGARVGRGVAIVTQSGNVGINLTMQDRSLPIATVVSLGNQACLDFADYVEVLAGDERISAIGLCMEGLSDVAAFSRAAAAARARRVPLVALKSGSSDLGKRIALSHTASLAGADELYEALFARLGVLRVPSLDALVETLKLLSVTGPLPGRRLALMSCSGGEAVLSADLAGEQGFTLPPFSEGQAAELRGQLSDFAVVSNPLDYNTAIWGDPAALERCFTTVLRESFDVSVLAIDYPRPGVDGEEDWDAALEAYLRAAKTTGTTAVVMSTLTELLPESPREKAIAAGVAPLQGLLETMTGLGAAARYGEWLERDPAGEIALPEPGPEPKAAQALDEWRSKRLLAQYGLVIPQGDLVEAEDAAEVAQALGFPVALKAVGPDLLHKSERGAVVLGLNSGPEVATAAAGIRRALAGTSAGEGPLLVERMVDDAVAELIIGVKFDPQFGLALVLGSGGVLVELVGDARSLLLPTSRQEIIAALDGLKVARLLAGYRGRPEGDREAVLAAVEAVARFAEAHRGRLLELDINPLLVRPRGKGAVVADAWIKMAQE